MAVYSQWPRTHFNASWNLFILIMLYNVCSVHSHLLKNHIAFEWTEDLGIVICYLLFHDISFNYFDFTETFLSWHHTRWNKLMSNVTWYFYTWVIMPWCAIMFNREGQSQRILSLFLMKFWIYISALPADWREISMKQSVGKCKKINF